MQFAKGTNKDTGLPVYVNLEDVSCMTVKQDSTIISFISSPVECVEVLETPEEFLESLKFVDVEGL